MPQAPFPCPVAGLVVVVDLWAGMGGLLVGLLAMGVRCVCLSVEQDRHLREAQAGAFSGLVHLAKVEEVKGTMLDAVLARRHVKAILIGGGAPCQGNSALNRHRKGLDDPRSQQPAELGRIIKEVKQRTQVPVFAILENVSSAPAAVVNAYSSLMGGPPLQLDAAQWGYTRRRRFYWLVGPKRRFGCGRQHLPAS